VLYSKCTKETENVYTYYVLLYYVILLMEIGEVEEGGCYVTRNVPHCFSFVDKSSLKRERYRPSTVGVQTQILLGMFLIFVPLKAENGD
jgi:hypothetical protein